MSDARRKQHPDVTRVLLADGWHEVDQQTFELDGHSFGFAEVVPVEGEHGELTRVVRYITGPLTSVLAVESQPSGEVGQSVRPPAWP